MLDGDFRFRTRNLLTHHMLTERPITLPKDVNKVFCSQWLNDRQVVFGTKCNKLMTYDIDSQRLDQIPLLQGRGESNDFELLPEHLGGIHSVQINPSRTLLATGAKNSNEIAIYTLPTFDPVCIGKAAHQNWVFDMCWLDDVSLVSGSKDSTMALWRFGDDLTASQPGLLSPLYQHITPLVSKECKAADAVRALAYNSSTREIAAVSSNGFINVWKAETFKQTYSLKLLSQHQENVCIAVQEDGSMYAIGRLLLDSRVFRTVKIIPMRCAGCVTRSCSFQGDILTIGTVVGMMFYDLRAGKYLESSITSGHPTILRTSKGHVQFNDGEMADSSLIQQGYMPTIFTHCYDSSGTRLFCAGGPYPAKLEGNYAGIWQ